MDPGLAGPASRWPSCRAQGSAPSVAATCRGSARCGLADEIDLAGTGVQHRGFLARDYPLDRQSDEAILARFDVRGYERLQASMAGGRGAILVGSHLGAHIAGVHSPIGGVSRSGCWCSGRATSRELNRRFDEGGRHSQAEFFLRRDLTPTVAVERILRACAALRDGLAIYLNGDIPGPGHTCPGHCWADPIASSPSGPSWRFTHAPVFLVFCTHAPGGRFALEIEPLGWLRAGEEQIAVSDYLKQLESRIANSPADAVAHLVWPCYHRGRPRRRELARPAPADVGRSRRSNEGLDCRVAC